MWLWLGLDLGPLEASFRKLAGDIVSPQNLAEMPGKISRLLDTREEFQQAMRRLRPQMVFNIGNSIERGAREIARLADEAALAREQRDV